MADSMRAERIEVRERTFIQQVYGWMAAALAVTGFVALAVSRSVAVQRVIFGNPVVFWGLIIGELVLVIFLARRIMAMAATTATSMFILYSVLNGLTLSSVFLVYTGATITQAFFVVQDDVVCPTAASAKRKKSCADKLLQVCPYCSALCAACRHRVADGNATSVAREL